MNYAIQTSGLTKTVKGKTLISDINLHVKKGEIYGFLGQNGTGKTTIMKMLTGITTPTSGEILLFNQKLTEKTKTVLKRVGSVIEYPIFYEHLTAIENMKLHGEYLGFYDDNEISEALDMVQLKDNKDKVVKDFSLGMKQRLGIARAIVMKPELIILDEPTNGLDPIGIKDIRKLIIMLNREYGITFLLSSHILGEMEQVVDRVGVIKDGKLLNEVTLADIRKKRTEYIELMTSNMERALYLLESKLQIFNLKMISNNRIRIYDLTHSQNTISKMLIIHDVEIEEMQKHTSSLEDYFYEQINGGANLIKLILLEGKKLKRYTVIGEVIIYWLILMFLPFFFIKQVSADFGHSFTTVMELNKAIQTGLILFGASLINQVFIDEYKNKTISLAYGYPINRKTLFTAKILFIGLLVFLVTIISFLLTGLSTYVIDQIHPIIMGNLIQMIYSSTLRT